MTTFANKSLTMTGMTAMWHHFEKGLNVSKLLCSFSVGFNSTHSGTSKFLLILHFCEVLLIIVQVNRFLRHIDRYLKNGVSKSIFHVIRHANFQLYRVHPDGVI